MNENKEINLSDSTTPNTTQLESFLHADDIEEKELLKVEGSKSKRHTSGLVKSIHNSASFLEANKYGESRRVEEFSDGDGSDFGRMSHKAR